MKNENESSFYGTKVCAEAAGLYQDDLSKYEQQEEWQRSFLDQALFYDLRSDVLSPPLETCLQEITEVNQEQDGNHEVEIRKRKQYPTELIKDYGDEVQQLNIERICMPCAKEVGQELSIIEILQIAGSRFLKSSSRTIQVASMRNNPINISSFGLSEEEEKNVELLQYLLTAAEKVGYQQLEPARRMLKQCSKLSSKTGNPVQRLVYYFSEALRERIDNKPGSITAKDSEKKQPCKVCEASMTPNETILAYYQQIPFSQVAQFTGIQAIVENVAEKRKIHIIDLAIRYGIQWTVFMQALVSISKCPPELLKITAIGTTSRQLIEDTGKRLVSFAETMNLPFSFKIVMESDMLDLEENIFELEPEEAVAVFCEGGLNRLVALPNHLDSIMKVIKKVNPCIMVVVEIEANLNSPAFINRFIECLFYTCAYFDCLETCMEPDDRNRIVLESLHFGEGIRNMMAAEGEERRARSVKIDIWRAFFARFGMMETGLSESSLYQAKLVAKKFGGGTHCTLDMNGKSLFIGWKGTPIHCLSTWKFKSEEEQDTGSEVR